MNISTSNLIDKNSPILVDSFSKSRDTQLAKIAKLLTPKEVVAQGYLKDLLLAKKNMTQMGMNRTISAFVDKFNPIGLAAIDECNEISKLLQTSGFIVRDDSIPKERFKLTCYGNDDNSIPAYIGLCTLVPFKLDNNLLMKTENFTEKEVEDHFNDIKSYWSILDSGGTSGIVDLVKKINETEDEFFNKARDFNASMSGKLFNRPYNTNSLVMLAKSCKNARYFSDPWISFCFEFESIRIKNNAPNFLISFELASFSNIKEIQSRMGTYVTEITLFYKVEKPFIGSFKFERNSTTY